MCFGSRCPRPGKNELGETGQVHQLLYNWPAAKQAQMTDDKIVVLCGNIFDGSAHVPQPPFSPNELQGCSTTTAINAQ